jgi:Immunity protein 22
MEENGIVSLWLGVAQKSIDLEESLQTSYSEDGDFEGSDFTRFFQIDFYDENFKESEFFEESEDSLESLLKGFSYDETIIPRFLESYSLAGDDFNVVVLLYNFRYEAVESEWQNGNFVLKFIGAVSYEQ